MHVKIERYAKNRNRQTKKDKEKEISQIPVFEFLRHTMKDNPIELYFNQSFLAFNFFECILLCHGLYIDSNLLLELCILQYFNIEKKLQKQQQNIKKEETITNDKNSLQMRLLFLLIFIEKWLDLGFYPYSSHCRDNNTDTLANALINLHKKADFFNINIVNKQQQNMEKNKKNMIDLLQLLINANQIPSELSS